MKYSLFLTFLICCSQLKSQSSIHSDTILINKNNYYLIENDKKISGNIPVSDWRYFRERQTFNPDILILKNTKTGKIGVIDIPNKKVLLSFIYDYVRDYQDSVISLERNKFKGLYFPKEKILVNAENKKIDYFNTNGSYFLLRNEMFQFYDKTQKLIFSLDSISNFMQIRPKDLIEIEKKGKFGIVDYDGKLILSPEYNSISVLDNGNFLLSKESNKGIYRRKDLKKLTKIPFYSHMSYKNITIGFGIKSVVFYDDNGNLLSELVNADIYPLTINSDGDHFYKQNNLWGIVSYKGKIVKKPFLKEYKIIQGNANYFEGKKNNKWEIYDYKGNKQNGIPAEPVKEEVKD